MLRLSRKCKTKKIGEFGAGERIRIPDLLSE